MNDGKTADQRSLETACANAGKMQVKLSALQSDNSAKDIIIAELRAEVDLLTKQKCYFAAEHTRKGNELLLVTVERDKLKAEMERLEKESFSERLRISAISEDLDITKKELAQLQEVKKVLVVDEPDKNGVELHKTNSNSFPWVWRCGESYWCRYKRCWKLGRDKQGEYENLEEALKDYPINEKKQ